MQLSQGRGYQDMAACCHFGLDACAKNSMKRFEWENSKGLSKHEAMTPAQVSAELKASNDLTK